MSYDLVMAIPHSADQDPPRMASVTAIDKTARLKLLGQSRESESQV